jgi:hypothetical protein
MDSNKENINQNKVSELVDEIEENSLMCLIVKNFSNVYIRYDVRVLFILNNLYLI